LPRGGIRHRCVTVDDDIRVSPVPCPVLRARCESVAHIQSQAELKNCHEEWDENQRHKNEIDRCRPIVNNTPALTECR
jgi:hypothetical protein